MADELQILEALKQVHDPELMVNVVDLGLIYNVKLEEKSVEIDMTLTSPACPAGPQMIEQVKNAIRQLDGVQDVKVNLVMTPPWSPERMTEEARDQLGIF
jgi:metal-sulfur cluster biosynthetic enzyme